MTAEKDAHVHGVECAFGSPTCPAFGEQEPPRVPWWRRLMTSVAFSASTQESATEADE